MKSVCTAFIFAALLLCLVHSFKWEISEELPSEKYFMFTERYMFANRNGPVLMDPGASFIKVKMNINTMSKTNRSLTIGMAIYSASEGNHDTLIDGICEREEYPNPWADNVEIAKFPTDYVETVNLNSPLMGLNGTFFKRNTEIDYHYTVKKEAWYNVAFVICSIVYGDTVSASISSSTIERDDSMMMVAGMQDSRASSVLLPLMGGPSAQQRPGAGALTKTIRPLQAHTEDGEEGQDTREHEHGRRLSLNKNTEAFLVGTISFHNPYGYIPAELFGMLPFQTARMVAYAFFAAFFLGHYYKYWESTIHLHTAFLLVFIFAMIEATLWFASYQSLNISGVPYCCPFPPLVIGALVLQVIRQTLSRCLLLVVSLGYGIVRPKLMNAEWAAVSVMTGLYLVAAIVAQGAVILFAKEAHGDFGSVNAKLTPYKIPAMVLDVIFLTWIYLAVNSTIRVLTEFQQSVKLDMYKQLVYIIGVFMGLFVAVTVIFMLDDVGFHFIPWQCAWLEQVLWESLNFAVLAAVCVVCRPTATSQMLSYASQLPTEDPDDLDDDTELHGSAPVSRPWMDKNRGFVYGDEDEESFYDIGRDAGANSSTDRSNAGHVEMTPMTTRNPIGSGIGGLGKLGKKRANNNDFKNNNSNLTTTDSKYAAVSGGIGGDFHSLPPAAVGGDDDSEYGLDQAHEDW